MPAPSILENAACTSWEQSAEQVVRSFCGWHVAPVITETITLDVHHATGTLPLPSRCVQDVSKVELWNGTGWEEIPAEDIGFSRSGLLVLANGRFRRGVSNVRVTMTHGFELDEVADLIGILRNVSNRASMELGAVTSQSVNGASVSYATQAGGGAIGLPLLENEKALLSRYKLPREIAG